ncbi:MAG: hypothetical protein IKB90_03530 [Alistipes sp.]|nr:hypothetical protein [Alistipes sp.]
MLIVILAIGLAFLVAGVILYFTSPRGWNKPDYSCFYEVCIGIGAVISIITFIVMIAVGIHLSGRMVVDDKIALYKQENANIEEQVSTLVEEYKDYESNTLKEFSNQSPTVLVSLYPELKSNELVTKQIDLYVANNEKIKALECERIGYKSFAWWLYFGK